uniref:Uncharacterized protein n=1 Tax=Cajanus cajan TaxID=3821 RepID=A0A151SRQ2_CAJCA|nr:hypothetical protein KK1_003729 [Cajanus cajan]
MADSSKRHKGSSSRPTTARCRQQPPSDDAPTPTNPIPYTGRALALFSTDEQQDRYYQLFSERNIVDPKYISIDFFNARSMICVDNADMTGRILAGSIKFDYRIMHYIIVLVLLPRTTNLAQASEEDLILIWALITGREFSWAHLIRSRMKKALRVNASLPYPHFVTTILEHFNVPLEDETWVPVKRFFEIGASAIASFGYKKILENTWVRKRDFQAVDIDDRTPSPPPQDPSSALLSDVLNEIRDLRFYVGERFDSLDTRMTRLEEEVKSLRCPSEYLVDCDSVSCFLSLSSVLDYF